VVRFLKICSARKCVLALWLGLAGWRAGGKDHTVALRYLVLHRRTSLPLSVIRQKRTPTCSGCTERYIAASHRDNCNCAAEMLSYC
jgi:hypothetical protein